MKIIAAFCAIFTTGGPTFALSCVQSSTEALFNHLPDADQHYAMTFLAVHGSDFSYNPIMHQTAVLVQRFSACLEQGACRSIP